METKPQTPPTSPKTNQPVRENAQFKIKRRFKIIKLISMTFLSIIIVLAIGGFFLPDKWAISRQTVINGSKEQIFPLINNLANWPLWAPWNEKTDPTIEFQLAGEEIGEGSSIKWDSATIGNGGITITASNPDEGISYLMVLSSDRFKAAGVIFLEQVPEGTKVVWTENGEAGWNIIYRYFIPLLDNLLGGHYEGGLANLKNLVENPAPDSNTLNNKNLEGSGENKIDQPSVKE